MKLFNVTLVIVTIFKQCLYEYTGWPKQIVPWPVSLAAVEELHLLLSRVFHGCIGQAQS